MNKYQVIFKLANNPARFIDFMLATDEDHVVSVIVSLGYEVESIVKWS